MSSDALHPVGVFDSFVTRGWYNAKVRRLWSDYGTLEAWLEVEVALAEAQAELNMIPAEAARTIRERADARKFDLERLNRDVAFTQHPFVPALKQLEELCGEPAAGFLHFGATTQNIFDTGAAVQLSRTHPFIVDALRGACTRFAQLALEHKHTLQAGRTHGQHALPITFGFKVAGWLDELDRDLERIEARSRTSFTASLGGAIGSFAAMRPHGPQVESLVARKLGLEPAGLPLRSSFDRVSDYVAALGLLAGTAQRIGQDVYFLQRNEVGEVEEAFHNGKIGSSTMAQKRNPVVAAMIVSMARLLRARVGIILESMARDDEADTATATVSEITLPEVALLAVGIAETLQRLASGLRVYPDAMRRNLDLTQGLIMSESAMMVLSRVMGRHHAHHLLYEASQQAFAQKIPLAELLVGHPLVKEHGLTAELQEALRPENYVGESPRIAESVANRVIQRLRSTGR